MLPPQNVFRLPSAQSLSWNDCRLLVESVTDYAIFMLDVEGRVATWNLGAERIKGYRPHEIIGEHYSKFYTPEDVSTDKPRLQLEVAAREGRVADEGWRVRKDGSLFWASVVITALRDTTGTLRGYGKVTRDLTAQRAAERELHNAELRFHHLVDAVTDYAIFMLDVDGRVYTWNSGAKRLKGYTPEEIIGKHFELFYTAEQRAAGKPQRILDTVRQEGRYEDESWRVRKDGTRFWANVIITALRDDAGTLLGFAKVTRDLTDRRRTEEQLRRSEERFRLLVESVADYAIYMLDVEGHVATWNLGACRLKGYSADEIVGRHFRVFFPEDEQVAGKPERELAIAKAVGRFEDEGWRIRKDGSRFWANAVLTALHDVHGRLVGFAKVTRDLTARREAEEIERKLLRERTAREVAEVGERRVREGEERYRSLSQRLEIILEGVADGITVQDQSMRLVFANGAAARLCGFESVSELLVATPEQIVARFAIFNEAGKPFDIEMLPGRRVLRGEGPSASLLLVRHRMTQVERWYMVRAGAVHANDGTPELAVNIWHDVTTERQHELQAKYLADATAALNRSIEHDELLANLAEALVPALGERCAIHVLNGENLREVVWMDAREGATDVSRIRAGQRAHREIWNVLRTGESKFYNEILREGLDAQPDERANVELLDGVGARGLLMVPIRTRDHVTGALTLMAAEPGRRYGAREVELLEELGRRAGAALENAQLYAAAQSAAKAAEEASRAKDEFLATVSHELRTPLNAIVGWSALLKDRVTDPALWKPVDVILRNAQSQVKIIDDILDVSRVTTGKLRIDPRAINLVEITRSAIEVIRPSATAKRLGLEFTYQNEFQLLIADPERLQQVVWNLLSNAVKFTDPGGRIVVRVAQEHSSVVLSVADTGRGIDASFLPFVFDRFRQADSSITRRVGGLGLGLALVRHIVELHGGRVEASSEGLGHGSVFTLTLPVGVFAASGSANSESSPAIAELHLGRQELLRGIRVLVVDDQIDTLDLMATVLAHAGADVEVANSAAEGLDVFRRFRPQVLVSDIGMPGQDGYAFMRKVRELSPEEGGTVPAIALTALTREEDRATALAAGYTVHLGKPVNPEALTALIAEHARASQVHG